MLRKVLLPLSKLKVFCLIFKTWRGIKLRIDLNLLGTHNKVVHIFLWCNKTLVPCTSKIVSALLHHYLKQGLYFNQSKVLNILFKEFNVLKLLLSNFKLNYSLNIYQISKYLLV